MKYTLKVYSIWEFGQRKDSQGVPHQEDSMFPAYGKQSDSDRLFILCDGMGGHDAGEVASATVCEAMSSEILGRSKYGDASFTPDDFKKALAAAYEALDKKDSGAEKKMGTTLAFLKLGPEGAFMAHIGDSRIYQIRPGKSGVDTEIVFETEDHSLVNDLVKVGELTREEARHSKQKNVITRALQPNMGHRCTADIHTTSDIRPGDYFYICSDGMLEQPEMEDGTSLRNIFSDMGGTAEEKVEILKSVTENNRDNHTAFIIHILEVFASDGTPLPGSLSVNSKNTNAPCQTDHSQIIGNPVSKGGKGSERSAHDKFTAIIEEPANLSGAKKPKVWLRYLLAGLIAVLVIGGIIYISSSLADDSQPASSQNINIENIGSETGDNTESPLRGSQEVPVDQPSEASGAASETAPNQLVSSEGAPSSSEVTESVVAKPEVTADEPTPAAGVAIGNWHSEKDNTEDMVESDEDQRKTQLNKLMNQRQP